MKLPAKTVTRAVSERVGGKKPSTMRAGVTAVAAGGAVGAVIYRTLRN